MIAQALRQIATLLGVALLPAFVSGAIQLRPNLADRAEEITPAEILATPKATEIVWVDARSQTDYEAGHAVRAVRLNAKEWDQLIPPFLDAWHPEKLVVVYGASADVVAERMRKELQMKNVRVLRSDWQRWKEK